jgi:hypothetical protein
VTTNLRRSTVVVLAIALLMVGAGCGNDESDFDTAEAGDCLGSSDESGYSIVDCDSDDALYKVASATDGAATCDDEPDTDAVITPRGDDEQRTVCAQIVLEVGECTDLQQSTHHDCESGGGLVLLEVLEGTQDPAGCPEETSRDRVYVGDNKVHCLGVNP